MRLLAKFLKDTDYVDLDNDTISTEDNLDR
jgi:hypothetical protein